jgi:peptidyl-prolyl cis-trans isomerase SurA
MKEFKEGNMLFEVMERNVWGLAGTDSVGLMKHYQANRPKYLWPASADVLIFNSSNEKSAQTVLDALKTGKDWKDVADANIASLQVDSGRYELAQVFGSDIPGRTTANTYSAIIKNSDGTATFIKYLRVYPAGLQRSFEEAKGLVINDYQNVLEERWLAALRKKYPVKINETALRSLISK